VKIFSLIFLNYNFGFGSIFLINFFNVYNKFKELVAIYFLKSSLGCLPLIQCYKFEIIIIIKEKKTNDWLNHLELFFNVHSYKWTFHDKQKLMHHWGQSMDPIFLFFVMWMAMKIKHFKIKFCLKVSILHPILLIGLIFYLISTMFLTNHEKC
jgi:hypothetical protein